LAAFLKVGNLFLDGALPQSGSYGMTRPITRAAAARFAVEV